MSKLSDFLNPVAKDETQEIYVSDRFVQHDDDGNEIIGPDGKPLSAPFVIRALTEEVSTKIRKACTRTMRDRTGAMTQSFDSNAYTAKMVVYGTVTPDFMNSDLCAAYGTVNPEEVPKKMLYFGEYAKLSDAISELSGLGDDIEEEAKN